MAAKRGRTKRPGRRPRHPGRAAVILVVAAAIAVGVGVWAVPTPRAHPVARPHVVPVLTGADVSWPSCRHPAQNPMPGAVAFGIVGVNDGEPGTRNPCLTEQVAWAGAATGGTAQPRIGYYAIAADPFSPWEARWAKPVWPTRAAWRGRPVPIPAAWGGCRGGHGERGCAYVFGWQTAWRDAHLEGVVDAGDATWWLDVEAVRDWSGDPLFNQAIVEGMAAGFAAAPADGGAGARVGIYSNAYFWSSIVGDLRAGSPLASLPGWYPIGSATRAEAEAALHALAPLTPGGRIEIVQRVEGGVDVNIAVARDTRDRRSAPPGG